MKLWRRRGEILEHDGETFLEKLPFFTCGARETQSSKLRHCQNHELRGTTDHKSRVQPQKNCRFSRGVVTIPTTLKWKSSVRYTNCYKFSFFIKKITIYNLCLGDIEPLLIFMLLVKYLIKSKNYNLYITISVSNTTFQL